MLVIAGDVHVNPGPRLCDIFPCGYCEQHVSWRDMGIACNDCDMWYHKSCVDMSTSEYIRLSEISINWFCFKCNTKNHTGEEYHTYKLDVSNTYDTLNSIVDDTVFSLSHSSHFDPSLTVARPIPASDRTNYRPFQSVHPCPVVHPHPSCPVLGRPKHHCLCQAV